MNLESHDVQWLGEDEAHLGPAARAALGILLEIRDWTWWDEPERIASVLGSALDDNDVVTWGGGQSVLQAEDWVDARRAMALGHAFLRATEYQLNNRVRVARSFWSSKDPSNRRASALRELTSLFGVGRVFPEWQQNIKPQFDQSWLKQGTNRVLSSPSLPRDLLMPSNSEGIEWIDNFNFPDVVVSESIEALGKTVATKLVILYGYDLGAVVPRTFELRTGLLAQCALFVEDDGARMGVWFEAFLAEWSARSSVAESIEGAAARTGIPAYVLSSTKTFLLNRRTFARRSPKLGDGQAISDAPTDQGFVAAPRALRQNAGSLEGVEAVDGLVEQYVLYEVDGRNVDEGSRRSPPVERVLTSRVRQGSREILTWPRSGNVRIDIDIRPRTPLQTVSPAFPDDLIEWEGDEKTLQVHMFEFGRQPVTQDLAFRRSGRSPSATFSREVGSEQVDLRFLVSDGARILQTARFRTAPGKAIEFFVESLVTPIARKKSEFDVALLVNDSLGGQPSVAIFTAGGQSYFSPLSQGDTKDARDSILSVLEEAVADPTAPLDRLMVELADKGSSLLRSLRDDIPDWPGVVGRLQLVTQSDVFFPIEYLYEGDVPESRGAKLCPERGQCLSVGKAIAECKIRAAREYLCPMGFLGISGVIERHAWQKGKTARLWTPTGHSSHQRLRINDLSKVVFAASETADDFKDAEIAPHEAVRIANIEASLGIKRISTWPDWKAAIEAAGPSILLLVVHFDRQAAYIGEGEIHGLNVSTVNALHVGEASVVIAIGCNTGLGQSPGSSLPAMLQRGGAEVVIAAMTSVLGRHANRVARDLAVRLRESAGSVGSRYVGEVISGVRRQLLAEGLALGLSVVAFGDADVVLGSDLELDSIC